MSKKVLMIWPDLNGGMQTVIKILNSSDLMYSTVKNLITYKEGNAAIKLLSYFQFLTNYVYSLNDKDIKLVHIHSASKGSLFRKSIAMVIAKLFNKKILLQMHDGRIIHHYNSSPVFIKRIMAWALNFPDMILSLSKTAKKGLIKISNNKKINVLHNPIITQDYAERSDDHNKSEFQVVYLGYICKNKGCFDIIKAAELINNEKIKINLYGNGEIDKIKDLIEKRNLQNRVFLKGWISSDQKKKMMREADVLILPSYFEGLPMCVLEAMSYRMPVIATNVGGIPETIDNDVSGYLIKPGDYKALAEKLDLLANNPVLKQEMGNEGYRIVKEKFDVDVIVSKLIGFYEELLSK